MVLLNYSGVCKYIVYVVCWVLTHPGPALSLPQLWLSRVFMWQAIASMVKVQPPVCRLLQKVAQTLFIMNFDPVKCIGDSIVKTRFYLREKMESIFYQPNNWIFTIHTSPGNFSTLTKTKYVCLDRIMKLKFIAIAGMVRLLLPYVHFYTSCICCEIETKLFLSKIVLKDCIVKTNIRTNIST